jgi:hypothetical protein
MVPALPITPTGLSASAVSISQINLAWKDNVTDETGYYVQDCKGSACTNFTTIATLGASDSNTGMSRSTKYRYCELTYDSIGNSAYSNITSATTPR